MSEPIDLSKEGLAAIRKEAEEHSYNRAGRHVLALLDHIAALEAKNAELEHLFEMQWRRMGAATAAWRQAHPGNDLVLPDLGALLAWLLDHIEKLEAGIRRLIRDEEDAARQYREIGRDTGNPDEWESSALEHEEMVERLRALDAPKEIQEESRG